MNTKPKKQRPCKNCKDIMFLPLDSDKKFCGVNCRKRYDAIKGLIFNK